MIKLVGFGENFGVTDPSPFVLKIDAYMRMAGIEFTYRSGFALFRKAPKGKLPYIDDNGTIISDSFFIMTYLQKHYSICLDDDLSDEQKAITRLIIKSLDENFYWCIVYSRWLKADTWPVVKQAFFGQIPFPFGPMIASISKRRIRSTFIQHGMGKHNDSEILTIATDTLESLSVLLDKKPYFFGEKPSSLDAVAYGFLAQLILTNLDNPINHLAKRFSNLTQFCERIQKTYYSD